VAPPRRLAPLLLVAALTASAQTAPPPVPPVRLADFIVTPSRFLIGREDDGSRATLTRRELEALPQVGEDLFRAIARLPGVAADDFTARFWVRGAPQRQVLVRLDGADLIEPFHLKDVDGALAVVDLHAVDRLDLLTGGFNADYGNRAAAVLTIDTRTPAAPGPVYSAGLSLTGVRAGAAATAHDGRLRLAGSVRRGYPDLALKYDDRAEDIRPRYWDAYAKAEFDLAPGHVVSAHVLHAADTLFVDDNNAPDLRSSYDTDQVWLRWRAAWGGPVRSETVLARSWLAWRRDGAGTYFPRYRLDLRDRRSLATTALRQDWTLAEGDRWLWRAGWQAEDGRARYAYALYREDPVVANGAVVAVPRTVQLAPRVSGRTAGAFVAVRTALGPQLAVEPGLRFDRSSAAGDRDWSPRLNAAWRLAPRTTLRGAWGRYVQAQGLHELAVGFGDTTFHPSEKAEHRVVALEHAAFGATLRAEAYDRTTRDQRPQWFNRYDTYNLFPEAQSDRILLRADEARARGVELSARRQGRGPVDWTLSYARAEAVLDLPTGTIPAARDQRDTIYADLTYRPAPRWSVSAAWHYHSGWPITAVNYTAVPLNNGGRSLVRSFGPTLGDRLPAYHRLDLRVSRTIPLRSGVVTLHLDLFNAYDRDNLLAYDYEPSVVNGVVRDGKKPRTLLPLVPSLGVSWEG
jgi:outer membrane cobalamin receptor